MAQDPAALPQNSIKAIARSLATERANAAAFDPAFAYNVSSRSSSLRSYDSASNASESGAGYGCGRVDVVESDLDLSNFLRSDVPSLGTLALFANRSPPLRCVPRLRCDYVRSTSPPTSNLTRAYDKCYLQFFSRVLILKSDARTPRVSSIPTHLHIKHPPDPRPFPFATHTVIKLPALPPPYTLPGTESHERPLERVERAIARALPPSTPYLLHLVSSPSPRTRGINFARPQTHSRDPNERTRSLARSDPNPGNAVPRGRCHAATRSNERTNGRIAARGVFGAFDG
ncbi:hypothetical protein B0H12DRAFT_1240816 [Mycena haematopus]|nr:hypothetical protein B0H12DRAFT_1240816 [Mycena haematopus]